MAHFNVKNLFIFFCNSPPSKDAWVFAQWNAIQAVGVMSFGEVALNYIFRYINHISSIKS